jgi:tRNA-dihydrouridine synthase
VIAKLGYMPRSRLAEVVGQIADNVDGVSGINSIQAPVVNAAGDPVFQGRADGDQAPRRLAGISGIAIRDLALDFVTNLAELRRDHEWTFDIIGIGGVMSGHDVRALMAAGADAVQAATAAANNPSLPREVGCSFPEGSKDLFDELYRRVADTSWRYRTAEGLSRELGMDPPIVEKLLESHPEMIRKSSLKDRYGRATWTMSSQPPSRQEKLAKLRRLLARQ